MAFLRALIVLAGTLASITASAAQLYWIDNGGIHRANLDGSSQLLVVPPSTNGVWSMAADTSANKLYWIDGFAPAQFHRSNLDGTNPQHFLTVSYAGGGIFVHPTTHDVWWGGTYDENTLNTSVFHTTPDGVTTTFAFVPSKPDLNGFFIDASVGKLYNLDTDDNILSRYNLDGSTGEFLGIANTMAVNLSEAKIYYSDGEIKRANLDGTGVEPLITLPAGADPSNNALAVDPVSSTIFFGDSFPPEIFRVNPDGTGLLPIITTNGGVFQLLIVPEPQTLAMLLCALPLAYVAYRRQ